MRTLDEMVCFDLYAASRALTGRYRPLLEPLGLTYPQYLVLAVVPATGTCSVKELSARLELDHGTLSPLVRRLETAGLVARTRAAHDERVVEVRLTEGGRALRERFADIQCAVEESLGLGPGDVAALQETLKTLTARVRQETARETPRLVSGR